MDLDKAIIESLKSDSKLNFRPQRVNYASQAYTCLRDQYWQRIGVEPTNPIDAYGNFKMLIGTWIERGFTYDILARLQSFGYALLGTQIPIGGTNPDWDGYVDALISTPAGDKVVVELKTKSGYGVKAFLENPKKEISQEHLAQLGLYLSRTSEFDIKYGLLLYIFLDDAHFGDMALVKCVYDKALDSIHAKSLSSTTGETLDMSDVSLSLKEVRSRWEALEKAIKEKKVPKPDYVYMYPITEESVTDIPDDKLLKIIRRQIVWGDWQVLYSRYKDLAIKVDSLPRERTDEEIELCRAEYKRRHPKSKV